MDPVSRDALRVRVARERARVAITLGLLTLAIGLAFLIVRSTDHSGHGEVGFIWLAGTLLALLGGALILWGVRALIDRPLARLLSWLDSSS
jgi:hypothetical protein